MAAWVDCTGGSSYFRGWAADMGEYVGPWPLMPTAITDGFANYDEIDFYLGLPNPVNPSDPNIALDGSYDSQIFDAYRYTDPSDPTGSVLGWNTSSTGSALAPDGSTPPPAGYHLYAVAYFTAGEPPFGPEHYVPSTYARTGRATEQTFPGGWSDWQSALTVTGTTGGGGSAGSSLDISQNTSISGWGDLVTLNQSMLAAGLASGATAVRSGRTAGAIFRVAADKTTGLFGGTHNEDSIVVAAQRSSDHAANTTLPSPPTPLVGEVLQVDYGDEPFADTFFEYESGSISAFAWGAYQVDVGGEWDSGSPAGDAAGIGDLSATIRLEWYPSPLASGSGVASGGTFVADLTASTADTPWADTFGNTHTVTLPSGVPTSFTMVATPLDMETGSFSPTSGPDFSASSDGSYGWTADLGWLAGPAYSFLTPRWRFWRPNFIGPAPSTAPALRLIQRNDGLGVNPTPRIGNTGNSPSSEQLAAAPRITEAGNTYH